jgi:hypothetical protein
MMGLIYVNLLLQNKAPAIHVGVLVFSSRVYFYLEWTCVVCLREKGNARAERAGTGEGYHPSAQKWKTGRGFYTVFWTPFVVSLIAYGISVYHIRPLQEEAAHSIEYAVLVVLSCFPAITRLYLLGRNTYFLRWVKVSLSEKDDDVDLVRLVDRFGLDVMVYGNSLITAAAGKGAIKCLRKLIDLGASLHPKKGIRPVHEAIRSKQNECLIVLIEAGASFDSDLLRDILLGPMDSGYNTEQNPVSAIITRVKNRGYDTSLESLFVEERKYTKALLRETCTSVLDTVLILLLARVEERGYEPSLEKHPEYQKNPIIQAGILRYITEKGYDDGLEAVFEKEPALFEEEVECMIHRAEKRGYEESLLLFIKKHPSYENNPIIQNVFRESCSARL